MSQTADHANKAPTPKPSAAPAAQRQPQSFVPLQRSPGAVPTIQRIGLPSLPNPLSGLIDSLKQRASTAGNRIKTTALGI